MSATTILLYGRTNSGKSTQIGVLAEHVFKTSKKKTRLYTADRGGIDPIRPYVTLGIIEVEEIGESDPWIFTNRAAKGCIKVNGKWILDKARNSEVGFYAFESAHSITKLMKLDMERKAALGINIGGDSNTTFEVSGDGEKLKIGTTKGYQKFNIPQNRILEEILESQRLPAEYVLWTAGASRNDDEVSTSGVVGPDVIGKALTGTLPMDFNFTFRVDVLPAQGGNGERHLLFLGNHLDSYRIANPAQLGSTIIRSASALGNIRRPLDALPLKELVVEPADLVKALNLVREEAQKTATEAIKKRLSIS